ncbi:hypothetical protein MCHI_001781 [Candidatus Magnetoovum chiemensis]|nr:hypothetical protein MCHI_001781 [Candidatus Magnetoovum chiemensis]
MASNHSFIFEINSRLTLSSEVSTSSFKFINSFPTSTTVHSSETRYSMILSFFTLSFPIIANNFNLKLSA